MLPYEISARAINRIIGLCALTLPLLMIAIWGLGEALGTRHTQICFHDSLSHFYYARTAGDLFVGLLVAIGLMLMSFTVVLRPSVDGATAARSNRSGARWYERGMLTLAGLGLIGVALVPTTESGCQEAQSHVRVFATLDETGRQIIPTASEENFDLWLTYGFGVDDIVHALHFGFAAVTFAILLYFAWVVFRATDERRFWGPVPDEVWSQFTPQKRLRNRLYALSSVLMLVSVASIALLLATHSPGNLSDRLMQNWNAVFVFESMFVMPFGMAWLVKGRLLKAFNDPDERPMI